MNNDTKQTSGNYYEKAFNGNDCEKCGDFVEGFSYDFCCSGSDCGCLGLPVDPCLCEKFYDEVFKPKHTL